MSVTIEYLERKASINDYKWKSESPAFEDYLNSLLDPDGASGADPNPDLTEAKKVIEMLQDAKIIKIKENHEDAEIDMEAEQ